MASFQLAWWLSFMEHCTGIAEVMGSTPADTWTKFFFRLKFHNYSSYVYNCEDRSCLHRGGSRKFRKRGPSPPPQPHPIPPPQIQEKRAPSAPPLNPPLLHIFIRTCTKALCCVHYMSRIASSSFFYLLLVKWGILKFLSLFLPEFVGHLEQK